MSFWEVGTIKQMIGELVYIVQGPKNTHKRHMNQLRIYRLNESKESPQIPVKSRSTQYSIISILTPLKSLRKYDAREEKENLRNHST